MAELPPVAQRHLDLWQQREKRLSQLVFALLLFALLGEWKIVAPLVADAREHARLQQQSKEGTQRLAEALARKQALAPMATTLAAVGETIQREPWREPTEELKRQYAELRAARDLVERDFARARAILADEPRARRLDAARERDGEPAAGGAAARPIFEQASPMNAANRPAFGERERIEGPPEVVALAALDLPSTSRARPTTRRCARSSTRRSTGASSRSRRPTSRRSSGSSPSSSTGRSPKPSAPRRRRWSTSPNSGRRSRSSGSCGPSGRGRTSPT
jgi:hypothetical protein